MRHLEVVHIDVQSTGGQRHRCRSGERTNRRRRGTRRKGGERDSNPPKHAQATCTSQARQRRTTPTLDASHHGWFSSTKGSQLIPNLQGLPKGKAVLLQSTHSRQATWHPVQHRPTAGRQRGLPHIMQPRAEELARPKTRGLGRLLTCSGPMPCKSGEGWLGSTAHQPLSGTHTGCEAVRTRVPCTTLPVPYPSSTTPSFTCRLGATGGRGQGATGAT